MVGWGRLVLVNLLCCIEVSFELNVYPRGASCLVVMDGHKLVADGSFPVLIKFIGPVWCCLELGKEMC